METLYFKNSSEIKKNKKILENKLKISLSIKAGQVSISGKSIDEYEALLVLEAIQFGFSAQKALQLKDPDMQFQRVHIRDFTRRKSLKDVIARLVGTKGKTKRTLENITGCEIIINDNEVGIIGFTDAIEDATTAIKNIIKGTKQANAYKYLERMNASKRSRGKSHNLGLKDKN